MTSEVHDRLSVSDDDKVILLSLLGPHRKALHYAKVDALNCNGIKWTKIATGILVLAKENGQHFFTIYCLETRRILWETNVLEVLDYKVINPNYHSFIKGESVIAFKFEDALGATRLFVEFKDLNFKNRSDYPKVVVTDHSPQKLKSLLPKKSFKLFSKPQIGPIQNFECVTNITKDDEQLVVKGGDEKLIQFLEETKIPYVPWRQDAEVQLIEYINSGVISTQRSFHGIEVAQKQRALSLIAKELKACVCVTANVQEDYSSYLPKPIPKPKAIAQKPPELPLNAPKPKIAAISPVGPKRTLDTTTSPAGRSLAALIQQSVQKFEQIEHNHKKYDQTVPTRDRPKLPLPKEAVDKQRRSLEESASITSSFIYDEIIDANYIPPKPVEDEGSPPPLPYRNRTLNRAASQNESNDGYLTPKNVYNIKSKTTYSPSIKRPPVPPPPIPKKSGGLLIKKQQDITKNSVVTLEKGKHLAEHSQKASPISPTLMSQIAEGIKLKRVEPNSPSTQKSTANSFVQSLKNKIEERRIAIAGDGDDYSTFYCSFDD